MDKKLVNCITFKELPVAVGEAAKINTLDHPHLSNKGIDDGNITITSPVLAVYSDGFETENTRYRVVEQLNG